VCERLEKNFIFTKVINLPSMDFKLNSFLNKF
jgi:hypothetical protein